MPVEVLISSPQVQVVESSLLVQPEIKQVDIAIAQSVVQVEIGAGGAVGLPFQTVPFQWNVVNPFPLWTGVGRIVHVRLVLDVPFDAIASTLTIGDAGDPSRLMGASQSYLSEAGTYESHPLYVYASSATVNLYLSLGVGNTVGSGEVILYFD